MGNMMNLLTLINEQYESMDVSEIQEMIKILDSQTQNTYRLIENLLYWSRSQLGQIVRTLENVKVKTLISDVVEILLPLFKSKNISVELHIDERIEILADIEMSRIVFRNILSNAVNIAISGACYCFCPREREQYWNCYRGQWNRHERKYISISVYLDKRQILSRDKQGTGKPAGTHTL